MANSASRLPQEIITEILLRLPAKSIGQFRCVSKPWRALLCNPKFVKDHLSRHTHDQEKLLVLCASHSLFTLTFSAATTTAGGSDGILKKLNLLSCEDEWKEVVGSCNGLGLVVNGEGSKYLINPTTLEYAKLSDPPAALDPRNYCIHGFGYDSVNDDYKIVILSYYDPSTDSENSIEVDYEDDAFLDIYSAKMGSWRRLDSCPCYHDAPPLDDSGLLFLNGALHWLAFRKSPDHSYVILAFNLANEVFVELPPPAPLEGKFLDHNRLVDIRGCLCLVDGSDYDICGMETSYSDDEETCHTDVWVMKEYGVRESWTKFCVYGIHDIVPNPIYPFGDEEYVAIDYDNNVLVHNLRQKTSRAMVIDGDEAEFKNGVTFRESLLSPNLNSWNEESSSQGQD